MNEPKPADEKLREARKADKELRERRTKELRLRRWLRLLIVMVVTPLVLFSCCCAGLFFLWEHSIGAGTFDDEPHNWVRAFVAEKPDDFTVIRSRYWRSPHWTVEFVYFFHIASNETVRDRLHRSENVGLIVQSLVEVGDAPRDGAWVKSSLRPSWFCPKATAAYEIWSNPDQPGNTWLFVDRENGDIFFAASQL